MEPTTRAHRGLPVPAAYGAIAALAAGFAFKKLFDHDGFWMLAAGRETLAHGLPRVNTLSHTYPEYPWKFTQWLTAVILALAEQAGGVPGVQVLLMLCSAALFVLITRTARLNRRHFRWAYFLPWLVAAMAGMQSRLTPRGDLATLLGLACVPLLWSVRPRRLPLLAAVLAAVWSNLHAGVAFGLAEWLIFAGASLLRKDRESAGSAVKAAGAFLLGSLANPFGAYPYAYVLENARALRDNPLPIAEILPPSPTVYPFLWAGAALALPALFRALRQRDFTHVLLFLFFAAMATRALRFVPYFLIVTLPGTANHSAGLARSLRRRGLPRAVLAAVVISALGVLGWGTVADTRPLARKGLVGWGVAAELFPEGACDYILRRDLPGRLFNEFDHGGYVAWRLHPGRGVFIDGRTLTYPAEFFRESLAYRRDTLRRLVDTYGVDVAIVQRRPDGGNIDTAGIFDDLGWGLVYLEGPSYLFVRPGSPAERAADGDRYRIVKPWRAWDQLLEAAVRDPGRAVDELSRVPVERLIDSDDHRLMAAAAFHAGSLSQAERFLSAGRARTPDNLSLLLERATVLDQLSRTSEARADLERVVKVAPRSEEAALAREALRTLAQGR